MTHGLAFKVCLCSFLHLILDQICNNPPPSIFLVFLLLFNDITSVSPIYILYPGLVSAIFSAVGYFESKFSCALCQPKVVLRLDSLSLGFDPPPLTNSWLRPWKKYAYGYSFLTDMSEQKFHLCILLKTSTVFRNVPKILLNIIVQIFAEQGCFKLWISKSWHKLMYPSQLTFCLQ